jgi:hypothetical protein
MTGERQDKPNRFLVQRKGTLNGPGRCAPALGGGAIPYLLRVRPLMSEVPSAPAESKGAGRRFRRWRRVLLGIASLSVVFAVALCIWVNSLPPFWWLDHDKATYARISKAIAADPRPDWGTRLYDFIRELDLEDIPWDDGFDQNSETGCLRIYHFRGFSLYVHVYVPLEYCRHGDFRRILREEGSPQEKRQACEVLRIAYRPHAFIDGINSREERMRRYWAVLKEEFREANDNEKRHRLDRQN